MKKLLYSSLMSLTILLAGSSAFAQFQKGDKLLNLGIGGGGIGYYSGLGGIAIGGSFEVGITDYISVGAQADLRTYSYAYGLYDSDRYVSFPIAGRGSYHFGKHFLKMDNLDLYGGAALGFNIDNSTYYDGGVIVFGVHAGARYYFKPSFGVFAELGGGANIIPAKAGVTFKF